MGGLLEPDGYERLMLAFESLAVWLNRANRKVLAPNVG
jgi:hypothetical protein